MRRCQHFLVNILSGLLGLTLTSSVYAQTDWQFLKTGLEYKKIAMNGPFPWSAVHAFRIDLKHYRLKLAIAKELQLPSGSVRQLARQVKSPLAINGGFFTPEIVPIGLRLSERELKVPFKNISWWGIFYIMNKQAHLVPAKAFEFNEGIDFAIQSGPRLLVNRHILPLKAGIAERSALCINASGEVLLIATKNAAMSTTDLAKILKAPEKNNGLNCIDALNLDGGHSTQLYAKVNDFTLNIIGFSSISDAIYITAD